MEDFYGEDVRTDYADYDNDVDFSMDEGADSYPDYSDFDDYEDGKDDAYLNSWYENEYPEFDG